jgi:hypothetical protein
VLFVSIFIIVCSINYFIFFNKFNHLDRTNTTKYRTLDPTTATALISDIKRFVFTAHSRNADTIRILSNLNDGANDTNYKTYRDFTKYDGKFNNLN